MVNKRQKIKNGADRVVFKRSQIFATDWLHEVQQQVDLLHQYKSANRWVRGAITRALAMDVREMVKSIGIDETLKRLEFILANNKFRPRDLPIADWIKDEDLLSVGGPFSTYDAHLTQMVRNHEDPAKIRQYMDLPNSCAVADNYTKLVEQFCDDNPDLCRAAIDCGSDGDIMAYNQFFLQMARFIDNKLNNSVAHETPEVQVCLQVVDVWPDNVKDEMENSPMGVVTGCQVNGNIVETGQPANQIIVHRANIRKRYPDVDKKTFFALMCETFIHEFGHFVDARYPDAGMLGWQKAKVGEAVYDKSDEKTWEQNPTEESSRMIDYNVLLMLLKKNFDR